jgi:hypothetical protein
MVRFRRWGIANQYIVLSGHLCFLEDAEQLSIDIIRITEILSFLLLTGQVIREIGQHIVFRDDVNVLSGANEVIKRTLRASNEVSDKIVGVAVGTVVVDAEQAAEITILRVQWHDQHIQTGASVRDSEVSGQRRFTDATSLAVNSIREHNSSLFSKDK